MKQEERQQRDMARLHEMLAYERDLWEKGFSSIAGIDEAGRGPLAGPVVAAAVILPADFAVLGIDDSKKLSAKKRELCFDEIQKNALAYGFGIVDNQVIDQINILQATKQAMRQAVCALTNVKPDYLLIDALTLKDVSLPQSGIIKGDAKSLSIAAASILAKVTRDRLMADYHKEYPAYGFDQNKGYGTRAHYEGIEKAGICPIHRKTFLKNIIL